MKKILTILATIMLAFALLSVSSVAAEGSATSSPSYEIDYYGRNLLVKYDNSEELLYVYDALVEGVEASRAEIDISEFGGLYEDELKMVLDLYRYDHAEHFWLGNGYSMMQNERTDKIVTFIPTYTMSGSKLMFAKMEFNTRMNEILSRVNPDSSDFEKELFLHDAIAESVTYDKSRENAHNAYGALVDGYAVCDGYAEALQCLLQRVGIQSFIVTGNSFNPSTSSYEGHAWNYVRLGGKYYHVDLTWDDQEGYTFHAYFNVTDEYISADHEINDTAYDLPVCNSIAQNYFTVTGGKFDGYNVITVADYLSENSAYASLFLGSAQNASDFLSWFFDSSVMEAVISEMGISGAYSTNAASLGGEVLIRIDGYCSHDLTHNSASTATCSTPGNREHYLCNDCGKYFSDVYAENEIQRNSVFTPPTAHSFTKRVEDSDHLRSDGDCLTSKTYWLACSFCDGISDSLYFESEEIGDHRYTDEYKKTDDGHYRICDICDTPSATEPHTSAIPCEICHYDINHEHRKSSKIEGDESGHWYPCIDCSSKKFEEAEHTYTNACDETCNDCGWTRDVSHSFTRIVQNYRKHMFACDICGALSERVAHDDSDNDGRCDVCERTLEAARDPISAMKSTLIEIFADTRPTAAHITLLSITGVIGIAIIIMLKIMTVILFKDKDD